MRMTSRYSTKDGFCFGPMGWQVPTVHGNPPEFRNERGLTNLSFEVDDIAATEGGLLALGAASLPVARVHLDRETTAVSLGFLAHPGSHIELFQQDGAIG